MSAPPGPDFDPFGTLVLLRESGDALTVAWTPDVFRRLEAGDGDRVVGAKRAAVPADFHADEWEIHPAGDELLYLVTGAVDVVLDEPGGERTFGLGGGRACLVPRGVWRRLIPRQPSDLLFVTPAHGTRHRPVGPQAATGRRPFGQPRPIESRRAPRAKGRPG